MDVMCFFFSDLLKKIDELTEERNQLMKTVEDLREKQNKFTAALQEIEAQRETAVQNISQVNMIFIWLLL